MTDISTLKIAVSMRVTEASGYAEVRDTIARDWTKYLMNVFPNAKWLLVPNIGQNVITYLEKWHINALILTGGDDLGRYLDRDSTEKAMFQHARKAGWPILGVCRGLQAIYFWLGGGIETTDLAFVSRHVAKNHSIQFGFETHKVNSFHRLKLDSKCPSNLKVIARCWEDNTIEAVKGNGILGIMWHPEREENPQEWETHLIREFFQTEVL